MISVIANQETYKQFINYFRSEIYSVSRQFNIPVKQNHLDPVKNKLNLFILIIDFHQNIGWIIAIIKRIKQYNVIIVYFNCEGFQESKFQFMHQKQEFSHVIWMRGEEIDFSNRLKSRIIQLLEEELKEQDSLQNDDIHYFSVEQKEQIKNHIFNKLEAQQLQMNKLCTYLRSFQIDDNKNRTILGQININK